MDEQAIRVALDGSELQVDIPVTAEASSGAAGDLKIELIRIGETEALASAEVDYDLNQGQRTTLEARLSLPQKIEAQAPLVDFTLRVSQPSAKGVRVTRSAFASLPRFEVHVDGPARVSANKRVSYRVRAHDPETFAPIEAAPVELTLAPESGAAPRVLRAETDSLGDAFFDVQLEQPGAMDVTASAHNSGAAAKLANEVTVESTSSRVLLTTDKPLYQPGQTVHLRALSLARGSNVPLEKEAVVFEIEDAKANKILKRSVQSDSFGVAATTFTLGNLVNLGAFKARAVVGQAQSERGFEVARYALPKFSLDATLDRPWYRAAETLHGRVDARYFFGKNVANADVTIEAATLALGRSVFQQVMGKTDASGHMEFAVTLPSNLAGTPLEQGNALVSLQLKVSDAAGQSVVKDVPVTVAQNPAELTLVPEGTKLVPGVENRLFAFLSDPVGAPVADADVMVRLDNNAITQRTDAFGQSVFTLPGGANPVSLQARVILASGNTFEQTFTFTTDGGAEHVLVRSDRAVYDVGETAKLEIVTSDETGTVYLDWLNEGQSVQQQTVETEDGRAEVDVELDSALLGSNRVEAYIVDSAANVIRAGRSLFVRSASALAIEMSTDKPSYLPGEPATLTFSVRDEQGTPKVAALGVQIVDEALFSLSQATPGLLRAYFELDDAFSTPHYQIGAPLVSLPSLVFDETRGGDAASQAAQTRATAAFAALDASMLTGIRSGSWTETKSDVNQRLTKLFGAEKMQLQGTVRDAVDRASTALAAQGCTAQNFFCSTLGDNFANLLGARVSALLLLIDPWGQPYAQERSAGNGLTFTSPGPDEKASTWDDQRLAYTWSELGLPSIAGGGFPGGLAGAPNAGGIIGGGFAGGAGGGAIGGLGGLTGGANGPVDDAEAGAAPRVRSDFPETLYVNPAVITGADGTARVQVPLADSITQWRVSSLASTRDGKLGGSAHGVTVFQEFFADIDFPAELTRGDEVSFPIAVYNYLDQPQAVTISLQTASWFTARGPTSATLQLPANGVAGVSFPVRVNDVGLQSLRVTAQGSARSDALQRTVRVVPDGKAFPRAQSGSLAAGSVQPQVSFPSDAVPGSGTLELSIYPGFTSSVVSGMDSMLNEPYGCFEQTTSTTWPNVLVQHYLGETGQLSTETRLKAEAYISAGYQRLMTFEHPGGGFSWFGTQDPAPYLSVTAFGVMEFVDMAEVYPVDPAMVARTVAWLAAQQKDDGTFPGDQTEFFSFHTSVVRNTAFVAWALATAGEEAAATRALGYLSEHYEDEEQDAYTLALVANAFALADPRSPTLAAVLQRLQTLRKTDGDKVYWDSQGTQTNFYGEGRDADVATTALVTLALLSSGGAASDVKGALDFLAGSRDQQGNFGSTQATIWTLRALLLAATKGTEGAVGALTVAVDGDTFRTVELTEDQSDVTTSLDLSAFASTGVHEVLLSFAGTGKLSYNLVSNHHLPWSRVPAPPAAPLSVSVSYDRTTLPVNDLVNANVDVRNLTAATQNMVLVDVGVPPGFEVETADLDALVASSQVLSKHEVTPRQLILYLSSLAPNARERVQYRLRATMPVKAADGGAKVYPYYEPTRVSQVASKTLEATP